MKQKIRTKKIRRQLKRGGADQVAAVKSGIAGNLYENFGEVISAVATVIKQTFETSGTMYGKVEHTFFDTLEINIQENTVITAENINNFNYVSFVGLNDTATVTVLLEDKKEGKLTLKLRSPTIDKERDLLQRNNQPETTKLKDVAVYFSERPIKNIGEFIKYTKANKGPSTTLLALARQKDAGAAAAAAAASGVLAAGNLSVTILASSGVGLPLAGAIAGLLLITNKLANMYIHKLKMKAVLYDVITIVSSCFIIYDLIDRVIMITTIVLNHNDEPNLQLKPAISSPIMVSPPSTELSNPAITETGAIDLLAAYTSQIERVFKDITNYANSVINSKKVNQNRMKQIEKLKNLQEKGKSKEEGPKPDNTYNGLLDAAHKKKEQRLLPLIKANAVDQIPLEDRVSLNIDIQKRLYEKMQGLTEMLLKNAREKDLDLLKSDPQMQRSGFGAIVEKEIKSRTVDTADTGSRITGSLKAAYNIANRVYSRNFDSDTIRKDVMAELSLVLGYFFLLKNQYDLILDTYKDTIPEWPEIYAIIRETEEFKLLVVPPDALEYSKKVIEENEAEMETAAVKQQEVGTNGDSKEDDAVINPLQGKQVGALKTKKHNKKTKWHTRKNK